MSRRAPERPCLDELQVDPLVQSREVGRAPAEHDRTDEEPILIDEAQLHEGGGQAGAADGQLLSRLFLQLGDLFGNAFPDQPGIALDFLEGRREHDLRRVSFQMRANSSSCSGADGFSSAVSQ